MGYRDDYFKENRGNHGWYTCVHCGKNLEREVLILIIFFPKVMVAAMDWIIYNACVNTVIVLKKIV